MPWQVQFHDAFEMEFETLPEPVQDELLSQSTKLEKFGPTLGRPVVDTLKNSSIANLKELRFDIAGGAWRVAFAFNKQRIAVLLVAGNKSGVKESRFYKMLISRAEARWDS